MLNEFQGGLRTQVFVGSPLLPVTHKDWLIAQVMALTSETILEALPEGLLTAWLDVLAAYDCCLTLEAAGPIESTFSDYRE